MLLNTSSIPYNFNNHSIAPHWREDELWCQAQLQNPLAQVIIVFNGLIFLHKVGQNSLRLPAIRLRTIAPSHLPYISILTWHDGVPILSFNLSLYLQHKGIDSNAYHQQKSGLSKHPNDNPNIDKWLQAHVENLPYVQDKRYLNHCLFYAVRECFSCMEYDQLALISMASGLAKWHQSVQFCSTCAESLIRKRGGISAHCPTCDHHLFPRINPCVIMLVENNTQAEKQCLLAHHTRLPANMFSTIAGFIDIGESVENAVRREVAEEVGLSVLDLRYIASQSWTFSSSLMIGFIATVHTWDFVLDKQELAYARWFKKSELVQFGQAGTEYETFSLSKEDSIAYYLIQSWLDE